MDKELKKILEKNRDLNNRIEQDNWTLFYNKKSDMLIMGNNFPINTFYYPVSNTGVLLRIDNQDRIHGYAIENTKFFLENNPEVAFAFHLIVHPYLTKYIRVPIYRLIFGTEKSIDNIKKILSISNFVAGKAVYN